MADHRQLSLEIVPRLAYSPEGLFLHSGISNIVKSTESLLCSESFQLLRIQGPARCGKTHLGIYLADYCYRKLLFPRLVDGDQCSKWIEMRMERSQIHSDEVIFIDDAEQFLSPLRPGDSGPFVNFVEACRKKAAKIVFFINSDATDTFAYDEHVASRMLAGHEFIIEQPTDVEISKITLRLAKQRGLVLTDRHTEYLAKRVSRDIESIERYLDRVSRLAQDSGSPVRMPLLSRAL